MNVDNRNRLLELIGVAILLVLAGVGGREVFLMRHRPPVAVIAPPWRGITVHQPDPDVATPTVRNDPPPAASTTDTPGYIVGKGDRFTFGAADTSVTITGTDLFAWTANPTLQFQPAGGLALLLRDTAKDIPWGTELLINPKVIGPEYGVCVITGESADYDVGKRCVTLARLVELIDQDKAAQ